MNLLEILGEQLKRDFNTSTRKAGLNPTDTVSLSNTTLAIYVGALLKPMEYEPIFGRDDIIAFEALGRPRSEGTHFQIQQLSDQLKALELEAILDKISVVNAVMGADEKGNYPLTVNLSLKSALDEDFWIDLIELLQGKSPKDLIFEITEDPVQDETASIEHLHELKKMGFRFALDDVEAGEKHEKRLRLLGPIADFVKIEGTFLREEFDTNHRDLGAMMSQIKSFAPNAQIVAEHVHNFDEAKILFDCGVDAVQGRDLTQNDYQRFLVSKPQALDLDLS